MKNILAITLTLLLSAITMAAQGKTGGSFTAQRGEATLIIDPQEDIVVQTAAGLLRRDWQAVFGSQLTDGGVGARILVGTVGTSKALDSCGVNLRWLRGKRQAFVLAVADSGTLVIAGSDKHGTAYGLMELSRLIGVSPWEWWADAKPRHRTDFCLNSGYRTEQRPSVEYRGIFINDEDWGLMPWSCKTNDPQRYGVIGAKTTERIFELLLRLRANTYWPPMHECSQPFFMTEGNREVAARFGIYIGSSHCEPMASTAATEWAMRGVGDYDYVNNSQNVLRFWQQRVKEVAKQEIIYTVGMRGVHDGAMQGARTVDEQKSTLERVLADQRRLLSQYVDSDATKVPQVFIPYKEILDVYRAGLSVPDDVTLMWCDDNYGYIRHFPTLGEQQRSGGNGVYYHASYWGRPHDYLWLGTLSPALLFQQMSTAYSNGIQRMWILNVGDIKPTEYQIELFMDMAWNIDYVRQMGTQKHLENFLHREFGDIGSTAASIMREYYRLCYICKPEYLGNTRTEESDPKYSVVKDLPWSSERINRRLNSFKRLYAEVDSATRLIPDSLRDAWFQLVEYPVKACALMNKKMLTAQLARHGEADFETADSAYNSIVELTNQYNRGFNNSGKWRYIMDFRPRELPVFDAVVRKRAREPMVEEVKPLFMWNATDSKKGQFTICDGLGYEGKAAEIAKGSTLEYNFGSVEADSVDVELRLVPTHPLDRSGLIRMEVRLDGGTPTVLQFATEGRSEEWKLNILRNQAVKKVRLSLPKKAVHALRIKALDSGVVLDQVVVK